MVNYLYRFIPRRIFIILEYAQHPKYMQRKTIKQQMIIVGVCGSLVCLKLFFAIETKYLMIYKINFLQHVSKQGNRFSELMWNKHFAPQLQSYCNYHFIKQLSTEKFYAQLQRAENKQCTINLFCRSENQMLQSQAHSKTSTIVLQVCTLL